VPTRIAIAHAASDILPRAGIAVTVSVSEISPALDFELHCARVGAPAMPLSLDSGVIGPANDCLVPATL